ncbi:MAG: glycoside hydrolase family 16 protein [Puniceicoccales bacterium]
MTLPKPNVAENIELQFAQSKASYPGVSIKPLDGEFWDFSEFTCLEVSVTNTGANAVYATVRVDNKVDWDKKPWNSAAVRLAPGDMKAMRVFFGYGPRGPAFPLDTSKVSQVLFFTGKAGEGQALKVNSIHLTQRPSPFRPDVKPPEGYLIGGKVDSPAKEYVAQNGAQFKGGAGSEPLAVAFSEAGQLLEIKPVENALWDLRAGYQLELVVRNVGSSPVSPSLQGISDNGDTEPGRAAQPIVPGKTGTIVASFLSDAPRNVGKHPYFKSNKASAVSISAIDQAGVGRFVVESLRLTAPPITLPEWVGKRPPVSGDWKLTFEDDFEGEGIDRTKWNVIAPNYYEKISRFSKDNVIVKDGKATLLFEKRAGYHGDDPNYPRHNEYSTGFMSTYGKWVQRYGYFEARMKLPEAPGLWPAFWLMPDRGIDAGPQWTRADIGNGGMEFDIMEFLSGWGPYLFTTAFHYDGYGKDHKATGSKVYTGHDAEGYITTGLLWLPGLAVIYNNGEEVVRWETDRISNVQSNIIFTNVAGGWDNLPLDNKQLPAGFEIDYVRVWQRADLASDVDGVQSTQPTIEASTTKD